MDYKNMEQFEKLIHYFEKAKAERVRYYQRRICFGSHESIKHDYDIACGELFNMLKEIMNVT